MLINQKGNYLQIVGVLVVVLFVVGSYYFISRDRQNLEFSPPSSEEKLAEDFLLSVNHHTYRPKSDKASPYLTFQVSFPQKYLASSEEMLFPYDVADDEIKNDKSHGFDTVYLTTNHQALIGSDANPAEQNAKRQALEEKDACIMIKAGTGMTVDTWTNYSIGGYALEFSNEQRVKIGKYDVYKRTLTAKEANIVWGQAFIELPENVSYYFRTCSPNSDKDLDIVLQNFKVKGDL